MNDLTQYNRVRSLLRPGDLVMFWGRSALSSAIERIDAGPSHSAMIRQPLTAEADVTICQSTIQNGHNGVQTDPLGATIAGYDAGASIAAMRLADATRSKIDWFKFYAVIGAAEDHVGYDRSEEHTSELQSLRHLVCRLLLEKKKITICFRMHLDTSDLFCSETRYLPAL